MTLTAMLTLPLRLVWPKRLAGRHAVTEDKAAAEADTFIGVLRGTEVTEVLPATLPPVHSPPLLPLPPRVIPDVRPQVLTRLDWDVEEWKQVLGQNGNGHGGEDLLSRYERLIGPDLRPAYWIEATKGHVDNERLVESILLRALTPELLAFLDAAKAAGDA